FDRVLTDSKGRHLDVLITGRTSETVKFLRKSDNKEFEFKIVDLSEADREYVKRLPVWAPKAKTLVVTDRVQERLDDFEARVRILALEADKTGTTSAQKQNIQREVDGLRDEIIDMIMSEDLDVREIRNWINEVIYENDFD
ncbi:MAG: hypothetical protein AAGJ79_10040, partial [Verrucomicrobiota bacterium]